MKPLLISAILAAALGGCAFGGSPRPKAPKSYLTEADRISAESQALSSLAIFEAAVASYAKDNSSPPARLEDLVPVYLSVIPVLDLGLEIHPLTMETRTYAPEILKDGAPNPASLRDSGRWGYIAGPKPLIFIDCTHQSSRLKPWYLERGVF